MATSFAPDRTPVPGPSTWLPGGSFWAFRKDPLAFLTNAARTYGDIAGYKFGPQQVYLVSRPEWIEDVLVKSAGKFAKGIVLERAKSLLGEGLLTASGPHHLKQRRTIQPLFHRQHVQGFADAFVRHAARWRDHVTPGAELDITREMSGLTLGIIGETMFSSDVQGDADEVREALTDAVSNFAYAFIPGLMHLQKLPLPMFVRMRTARERLDRVIHRVIAARRAGVDKPEGLSPRMDLIAMLLAARDPENPNEGGMGDTQIRDEAMTIFLAGHETTANAMAWTWHLLGTSPDAEARLHDELDRVLGTGTDTPEGVSPRYANHGRRPQARVDARDHLGIDAPVSAGVDHGPARAAGPCPRQSHRREGLIGDPEPVGRPSRSALVAPARTLHPRAMALPHRPSEVPIFRSGVARGCASARRSRGPKPSSCSLPSRSGGGSCPRARPPPSRGSPCGRKACSWRPHRGRMRAS